MRKATDTRHCTATNTDGTPCGAWALRDDTQCFHHADSARQERAIARIVGGKRAAAKGRNFKTDAVQPVDAEGMLGNIAALLRDVAAMPSGSNRVMAFVQLSREAREWLVFKHALAARPIVDGQRRLVGGR